VALSLTRLQRSLSRSVPVHSTAASNSFVTGSWVASGRRITMFFDVYPRKLESGLCQNKRGVRPIVSIALILAAVFAPVGLMGGIQGRLNKQFAVAIAISMIISAFNALTLRPALSALPGRVPSAQGSRSVSKGGHVV